MTHLHDIEGPAGHCCCPAPLPPVITLAAAGAMIDRSARYVRRHLLHTPGAPDPIALESPGDVEGRGETTWALVTEEWLEWLKTKRYWARRRAEQAPARPGHGDPGDLPAALLSPAQRRRLGHDGRAA